MNDRYKYFITITIIVGFVSSCKTIEKSAMHGLISGNYTMKDEGKIDKQVYLEVTNEYIDVYDYIKNRPNKKSMLSIPLVPIDSFIFKDMIFKKESLDIDITSILLKYRTSVGGLPAQLNTDLNIALYVGWRHDNYRIISKKDELEKNHQKISNMGYDFGFFFGPGTTTVNPSTTNNRQVYDYSGMIIQAGFAGFLESNVASFGLSIGYDYLLNSDRKLWIYRNKPWVGFIVGIALN